MNKRDELLVARLAYGELTMNFVKRFLASPGDREKKMERVARLLKKIADFTPEALAVQSTVGMTLLMLNHIEEAIGVLSRAIENIPAGVDPQLQAAIYHNRSVCSSMNNDFSGALRDAMKAVELAPQVVYFWKQRGNCFLMIDDLDKALESYEAALILEPASALLLAQCSSVNFALGNTRKSLEQIDAAIALTGDSDPFRQGYLLARNRIQEVLSAKEADEDGPATEKKRTLQ